MKQYVYFYHAVCSGSQGENIVRHGVVRLATRIDTADKYLKFCKTVTQAFLKEVMKSESMVKDVEITTLQFLHEVEA